jgi:ribosome-binding factor A
VLVTNDLSHARIMVSVPGEEADKTRALEGLQSAAGFLRSRAARALTTRSVPELHFELDRGLEHAARISELLNDIRREGQD